MSCRGRRKFIFSPQSLRERRGVFFIQSGSLDSFKEINLSVLCDSSVAGGEIYQATFLGWWLTNNDNLDNIQ